MKLIKKLISKDLNLDSHEELRRVRTLLLQHHNFKVIQFINSMDNESIYHYCFELAQSFSLIGKKTILVNLNMRSDNKIPHESEKTMVHGIEDYLVHGVDVDSLIIPLKDNFDLITNNEVLLHSTDILNDHKLTSLFNHLKTNYEYVFVTTPSLSVCYDALVIGKHSDGFVYVKEDRLPAKSVISKHAALINQLNKPTLGILITDVEQ